MTRTVLSALLLGLASGVGAVLCSMRLREKEPPLWWAIIHGALAATGLGLLASFVVDLVSIAGTSALFGLMPLALVLFAVAALGGAVLLAHRLKGRPMPRVILLGHAVAALAGDLCLLLGIVTGH